MKKFILKSLVLLILIVNQISAQDFAFKDYNWSDATQKVEIPEQFKNENEIILERKMKIEIAIKNREVFQYHLMHEKVYLNSDDAIERNNKMYIPFSINESVLVNKARVILKNGKIIELNKKDIKEEIDEEKKLKYSFYAINGLEKGAIIEILYVLQEKPDLDGKTFRVQTDYPILNFDLELIHPSFLVFKTKSLNNLPNATIDDKKYADKVSVSVIDKDILGANEDESYSNKKVLLKLFQYKLDQNLNSGSKNLNNFKEFSTNFFDRINKELEKSETRAIEEFCKSIEKSPNLQEQIWNIENKIKKNIVYEQYMGNQKSIADVIKSKQASATDIIKLYNAVFKNFNVNINLVFTKNRFELPFEKDFESFENLSDILFYFPDIKKYLSPTEYQYRIPLIPVTLGNVNGLFIKEKLFAGVKMGIGEINFIDLPGIESTHDTMDIVVDFTKDFENPTITNEINFGGYSALNMQPIKDFVPEDQYKKIIKEFAENYTAKADYTTLTTENDGLDYVGKKPFILKVKFEGKDLIQKAGTNYIFSVGQIIGKQMELYQVNKRKYPVELYNKHSYLRKIKILLPKNCTVKNLEKFNMNYKVDDNGEATALFVSTHTKTDTEINVENKEIYNKMNYPLDKFEQYRAVINAAADFNKIVLVLNKN